MSTAVTTNGCWTAPDNIRLYQSCPLDDKERSKLVKDGGAYSGIFKIDFLRNCHVLGIVPHPVLMGQKKVQTVAEAEAAEEATRKAAEEEKEKEGKEPEAATAASIPIATAAIQPSPSTSPPTTSSDATKRKAPTTSGKGGRLNSAASEKPLTPAQKIAAELAVAMAALTVEAQKPVTELTVRGWQLDMGTAAALQMTIPASKQLTTLRFWNASLSPRAITLLSDCLKGSAVTKLYLDYNPLIAEDGQEPGLVYSVLLAPSSPLQLLSLRGNRIDDAVANDLSRTVANSKNLVVLDLFDNLIGDAGAESFAKTLGLNSTLQSLNLSHNRIGDSGARALAQAFQSVTIADKEDAKNLKKAGFKITTVKNKTMREANPLLKQINLSQNYIGEDGLKAWVDVVNEQIKYTPSKGLIMVDGVEVVASSLIPARLLPEKPVDPATTLAPPSSASGGSRVSSAASTTGGGVRKTPRRGDAAGSPTSPPAKPQLTAAQIAAAKEKKEEEDMRYPGQLNNLTQINLTRQYSKCTELTWFQLLHSPLIRWTSSPTDVWKPEGTLNVIAIDAAAAAKVEAARLAAQTEEDRIAEGKAREAAALEAARQAEEKAKSAAIAAEEKKKPTARKDRKQTTQKAES